MQLVGRQEECTDIRMRFIVKRMIKLGTLSPDYYTMHVKYFTRVVYGAVLGTQQL